MSYPEGKIGEIWKDEKIVSLSPDVGNFFYLNHIARVSPGCDVEIGDYTYIVGTNFTFPYAEQGAKLRIGKFCGISGGLVAMMGGERDPSYVSSYPFYELPSFWGEIEGINPQNTKGDITIGNDVMIGRNVTILSGRTIGDGARIGACSIVTHDIGPYEIWAGNPARLIKKRFTDNQIEALLRIKWWEWPIEKIQNNVRFLNGGTIQEFIEKFS